MRKPFGKEDSQVATQQIAGCVAMTVQAMCGVTTFASLYALQLLLCGLAELVLYLTAEAEFSYTLYLVVIPYHDLQQNRQPIQQVSAVQLPQLRQAP